MSKQLKLDHLNTANQLTDLMMIFAIKFVKRFEREARHELSPLQLHTLYAIHFEGPQTMRQLCDHIKMSKQQMTPLIDKLVELGYVVRTQDTEDRRNIKISVSEKGNAFIECKKNEAAELISNLLKQLPDHDVKTISRSTKDLIEVLHTLPDAL